MSANQFVKIYKCSAVSVDRPELCSDDAYAMAEIGGPLMTAGPPVDSV